MKRIWIFLMAMLSIVSFTGCDKTEEPNGPVIDYDNLFVASPQELQLLRMR